MSRPQISFSTLGRAFYPSKALPLRGPWDYRDELFTAKSGIFFSRVCSILHSTLVQARDQVHANHLNIAVDHIIAALGQLKPEDIFLVDSPKQADIMTALSRAASSTDLFTAIQQVIIVDKVSGRDRTLNDWSTDSTAVFAKLALKEVAFALDLPQDDVQRKFAEITNSLRFLASPLRPQELPPLEGGNGLLFIREYVAYLKHEYLHFAQLDAKAAFPVAQLSAVVRLHLAGVVDFERIDTGRAANGLSPLFADTTDEPSWEKAAAQLAAAFNAQRVDALQKEQEQASLMRKLQSNVQHQISNLQPRAAAVQPQPPAAPLPQQQQLRRMLAAKTPLGVSPTPPPQRTQPTAPSEESPTVAAMPAQPAPPRRRNSRGFLNVGPEAIAARERDTRSYPNSRGFLNVAEAIAARERARRASGEWIDGHPHGTRNGRCSNIVDGRQCGSEEHCKYDCPNYTCPLCQQVSPGHAAIVDGICYCPIAQQQGF